MLRDISGQAVAAGLLAAFVGSAGSFAVIIAGLTAAGATSVEAASGLMALSVAMGLGGVISSAWLRQPVSWAWSTPGAALLATSAALEEASRQRSGPSSSPAHSSLSQGW